jgi:hypothetical protein
MDDGGDNGLVNKYKQAKSLTAYLDLLTTRPFAMSGVAITRTICEMRWWRCRAMQRVASREMR